MCGRYTVAASLDELVEVFDVPKPEFDVRPRYNVAPGQDCPVVGRDRRGRRMGLMRWGFVRDGREEARPLVNARSETAARLPTFREAFARRRCLVPADGFYEWGPVNGRRVPRWFHPPNGRLLALAAVWEGRTFAILTTEANADVAGVHHRMPVLVPPEAWRAWLDPATDPSSLGPRLGPPPAGTLRARVVGTRVNSTSEDDPGLIDPVAVTP